MILKKKKKKFALLNKNINKNVKIQRYIGLWNLNQFYYASQEIFKVEFPVQLLRLKMYRFIFFIWWSISLPLLYI